MTIQYLARLITVGSYKSLQPGLLFRTSPSTCVQWSNLVLNSEGQKNSGGGERKGGPKTAKPHRNTPKNRKPHRIFSRIPKPRVHGGHNMKADVSKTCDIF